MLPTSSSLEIRSIGDTQETENKHGDAIFVANLYFGSIKKNILHKKKNGMKYGISSVLASLLCQQLQVSPQNVFFPAKASMNNLSLT